MLPPSTISPAGDLSSTRQSEFGPPRLTRFLEMPLDRYVNIVTAMINDGRFSHIGHCVLRLEGQTWGCVVEDQSLGAVVPICVLVSCTLWGTAH